MAWKKYFRPVNSILPARTDNHGTGMSSAMQRLNSWLPEYYQGPSNRLQRYVQYDQMDFDHEVHAALNTVSEFCTQMDETTGLPFVVKFRQDPSNSEQKIVQQKLKDWCKLNQLSRRIFKIFRSTLKYGDQFFIRDPETDELYWIDPANVEKVVVNETKGKIAEAYYIKNLDLNVKEKVASNMHDAQKFGYNSTDSIFPNVPHGKGSFHHAKVAGVVNSATQASEQAIPVDAKHIVHISLSEGLDDAWPFGVSELERVFKIYKQKELLEDAILIYRVHRAPERRVFIIDTGTMPPQMANQYLERVKHEVQQKRIPSRSGGGCFAMDTIVPLLDGRELTIAQLAQEYNNGKENWVYSCDPDTGEMVPGLITWAGVTQKSAQVIRLTLDNGETIICTPEHKFPIIGKGKTEAKDIIPLEDSMISFNTREFSIDEKSSGKGNNYHQVYNHSNKQWEFTHRSVANFFKKSNQHRTLILSENVDESRCNVIHHADYNRYNNDPKNLVFMTGYDHFMLHAKHSGWNLLSEEQKKEILKKRYDYITKNSLLNILNQEGFKTWRTFVHSFNKKASKPSRKITFDNQLLKIAVDIIVKNGVSKKDEAANVLKDSTEFMKHFAKLNSNVKGNASSDSFSVNTLSVMMKHYGYENWTDFKKKLPLYNHKVVSVEVVKDPIEVGTLTIDGGEMYHSYHTFAIKQGVYTFNSSIMDSAYNPLSMLEDYFFSQSADGRGSRVETLPGGDQLGQIDDLRYFNNKMMRALGVPSSYLPTGPEDGTETYNDGRVGTAFIQEFRFQKTCKRLQNQLIPGFDKEFKNYLRKAGVTIEDDSFEIDFTEPQNFSQYRQIQMDQEFVNVFNSVRNIPYISKRFALKRYLGWTDKDIFENEALIEKELNLKGGKKSEATLRQVGITSQGIDGMGTIGIDDLDDGMDSPDDTGLDDLDNLGSDAGDDIGGPDEIV